jgi:ancient ubiquitous protein 1
MPFDVSEICAPPRWRTSAVPFLIYAPLGVGLLALRLALLAVAAPVASALPAAARPGLFRLIRRCLGIKVTLNRERPDVAALTDGCVVAGNHVCLLDVLTVLDLPGATVMVGDPVKSANGLSLIVGLFCFRIAGSRYVTISDRRGLARFFLDWRRQRPGTTLYTTPELTIGNGRGLFRFHPGMLNRGAPVVPLAVRVETCFGMAPHPLGDQGLVILARLLMLPSVCFSLDFLDRLHLRPGEAAQDFADRVQAVIAGHLGIPATRWTREDKHALRGQAA